MWTKLGGCRARAAGWFRQRNKRPNRDSCAGWLLVFHARTDLPGDVRAWWLEGPAFQRRNPVRVALNTRLCWARDSAEMPDPEWTNLSMRWRSGERR